MAAKPEAYVDTSALIALMDRSDRYHTLFRRLFADPPALVTTPLVIAEGHAWNSFLFEMDPTYANADATAMHQLINGKVHPFGARAFTSSDQYLPTVQNHAQLFAEGFDVVMSYNLSNGIAARQAVNMMRGVSPP